MEAESQSSISTTVHAEDVELVEQLARLQQMHQQLNDLRTLLPTALLGPARDAAARPRTANPSIISKSMMKAAASGKNDIQNFKKDWHDEKTRQLFKDANAANTPQGSDSWPVDYQSLAKASKQPSVIQPKAEIVAFDSVDEAKKALVAFAKTERNLKLQKQEGDYVIVEVARMKFKIERDEAERGYRIKSETEGPLPSNIAAQIAGIGPWKKLENLLPLLEAYHDIRLQRCEKCSSLMNSDLDYPLVRSLTVQVKIEAKPDSSTKRWVAYHNKCES